MIKSEGSRPARRGPGFRLDRIWMAACTCGLLLGVASGLAAGDAGGEREKQVVFISALGIKDYLGTYSLPPASPTKPMVMVEGLEPVYLFVLEADREGIPGPPQALVIATKGNGDAYQSLLVLKSTGDMLPVRFLGMEVIDLDGNGATCVTRWRFSGNQGPSVSAVVRYNRDGCRVLRTFVTDSKEGKPVWRPADFSLVAD